MLEIVPTIKRIQVYFWIRWDWKVVPWNLKKSLNRIMTMFG